MGSGKNGVLGKPSSATNGRHALISSRHIRATSGRLLELMYYILRGVMMINYI
jgi:hypothetical protein